MSNSHQIVLFSKLQFSKLKKSVSGSVVGTHADIKF